MKAESTPGKGALETTAKQSDEGSVSAADDKGPQTWVRDAKFRNAFRDAVWASTITPFERLCALCFADHTKTGSGVYVATARGVERTGMGVRTWKRSVAALDEAGWLRLVKPGRSGRDGGRAAVCDLTIPPEMRATQAPILGNEGHTDRNECHTGTPTPAGTPATTQTPAGSDFVGINSVDRASSDLSVGINFVDRPDFEAMKNDHDQLTEWLEVELDGLWDVEPAIALGMWEDDRHPKEIRNTIAKRRRTQAEDDDWDRADDDPYRDQVPEAWR